MSKNPDGSGLALAVGLFVVLILLAVLLALSGCASAPTVKPKPSLASAPVPVAAIAVSMCGKAVALFVVMDDNHMTRFNGAFTALYDAVGPNQLPTERHVDAVPWDAALALAERAPLTSHVVVPCQENVL